jgi:hypothetical protein
LLEIGGEDAAAAIESVRREDSVSRSDDRYNQIRQAQRELSALLPTTMGERGVIAAGTLLGGASPVARAAATSILGYAVGTKDLRKKFTEGAGTELLGKAATAKNMKAIDKIIADAYRAKPGDSAAAKELAAKEIKRRFGIDVKTDDLDIYEAVLSGTTGSSSAERAGKTVAEYKSEYSSGLEAAGQAGLISSENALKAGAESLKAATTGLASELEELGIDASELTGAIGDLATAEGADRASAAQATFGGMADLIKEMAATGVTSQDVRGKSAMVQLAQRESTKLRQIDEMAAGTTMTASQFVSRFGYGRDSFIAREAKKLAAQRGGTLSKDDISDLVATAGAQNLVGLGQQGAGALSTALQAGKTPEEMHVEQLQQTAEMIDAVYAKVSGEKPIMPDSRASRGIFGDPDPDAEPR